MAPHHPHSENHKVTCAPTCLSNFICYCWPTPSTPQLPTTLSCVPLLQAWDALPSLQQLPPIFLRSQPKHPQLYDSNLDPHSSPATTDHHLFCATILPYVNLHILRLATQYGKYESPYKINESSSRW